MDKVQKPNISVSIITLYNLKANRSINQAHYGQMWMQP
jgi:hypothetical protein